MSAITDRIIFDAEISERKILRVPIHTVKPTPYNPAKRTAEGKKLTKLVDTIRQFGLAYPILITDDRELADGNRRLMACRMLGHTHIECIVSDVPRDDLFNAISSTPEPMASRGWLEIARGGRKVPSPFDAQYAELLRLVGTYGIDLLIRNGLGMNSLGLCKGVVSFDAKYSLPEIIMKVALHKLTNKVNTVIRSKDASRTEKVASLDAIFEAAA
jgi:hypothetical protein